MDNREKPPRQPVESRILSEAVGAFCVVIGTALAILFGYKQDRALTAAAVLSCLSFLWAIVYVRLRSRGPASSSMPVFNELRTKMSKCRHPDLKIYTFCGLYDHEAIEQPVADFRTIYHLWADATGDERSGESSNIRVSLASENLRENEERRYFRVRFENRSLYPPNVAFRPWGRYLLNNQHSAPYLAFDARVPRQEWNAPPIVMGVRIVDALATHWENVDEHEHYKIYTANEVDRFVTIYIDLKDEESWKVFKADGNTYYASDTPEFSLIAALVIEFGKPSPNSPRPGVGSGTIDIRNIRLERNRPI